MGKISIQDLAQILIARHKLDKRDAAIFVSAMFDIIQSNLEKDRIVKIKGLGTFKIIDVEDRESVNVNTGERVLIEGHNKITFTPDVLMKELVNKPFSQFETVVLNDGVDFEDSNVSEDSISDDNNPNDPVNMPLVDFGAVEDHKIVDITDEDSPEWVIEPIVKASAVTETPKPEPIYESVLGPEPIADSEPEPIYESESDYIVEPEPLIEEMVVPEPDPEPEPIQHSDPESIVEPDSEQIQKPSYVPNPQSTFESEREEEFEEEKSEEEKNELNALEPYSSNGRKWAIAVFAFLLGLASGYVFGNFFPWSQSAQKQNLEVEQDVPAPKPTSKVEPVKAVEPVDTVKPVPVETPVEKPADTKTVEPKTVEKTVSRPVELKSAPVTKSVESPVHHDKYSEMDPRVKYGAYRIVGTAQEVKVKEGDDLKKIARRILGPDMECYIEVYNGINSNTQLKVGQSIKIPKLELKKKKSN